MARIILNEYQASQIISSFKDFLKNEKEMLHWVQKTEQIFQGLFIPKGSEKNIFFDNDAIKFVFTLFRERFKDEPEKLKSLENLFYTLGEKSNFIARQASIDPNIGQEYEALKVLLKSTKDENIKKVVSARLEDIRKGKS